MSTLTQRLEARQIIQNGCLFPETQPIAEALLERGHGLTPFAPPHGLAERIFKGWGNFITLSPEERFRWQVGSPANGDFDDGYVLRKPDKRTPACGPCTNCVQTPGYDDKQFFHYKPHLTALLDLAGVDYHDHLEWFNDLDEMHRYCRTAFHKVLVDLDKLMPGFNFAKRFNSIVAQNRHVLRLLCYSMPMKEGQELAKDHTDRNFGTFHVAETHQGLVLSLPDADRTKKGLVRHDYVPEPGKVLMFTGNKAFDLSSAVLRKVVHGVFVPNGFVPQAEVEPRMSMVFFGHVFPEVLS